MARRKRRFSGDLVSLTKYKQDREEASKEGWSAHVYADAGARGTREDKFCVRAKDSLAAISAALQCVGDRTTVGVIVKRDPGCGRGRK